MNYYYEELDMNADQAQLTEGVRSKDHMTIHVICFNIKSGRPKGRLLAAGHSYPSPSWQRTYEPQATIIPRLRVPSFPLLVQAQSRRSNSPEVSHNLSKIETYKPFGRMQERHVSCAHTFHYSPKKRATAIE
jgi:hypothetical protein